MSNQLKGGSYQINPQGDVELKASTSPAPRAANTAQAADETKVKPSAASSKTSTTAKGKTA